MRYKLLLTGNNHAIIDDFFYAMIEEFECLTTSARSEDIINHINCFEPDALVYCMPSDSTDNTMKLISALEMVGRYDLKLILIGDNEACNEFIHKRPGMVKLTLVKPITANMICQKIVKFFENEKLRIEHEKEERLRREREREAQLKKEQEEKLQKEREAQLAAQGEELTEKGRMKHILVIDDDPIILGLLKTDLATAVSGKIGLNFLQRKKTDLILLDYEMPEENGPQILEKLRANDTTKNIPVVFLTGINDSDKIKKVLAMKPQGYLLKPIDHDKLVKVISQIIG